MILSCFLYMCLSLSFNIGYKSNLQPPIKFFLLPHIFILLMVTYFTNVCSIIVMISKFDPEGWGWVSPPRKVGKIPILCFLILKVRLGEK